MGTTAEEYWDGPSPIAAWVQPTDVFVLVFGDLVSYPRPAGMFHNACFGVMIAAHCRRAQHEVRLQRGCRRLGIHF